MATHSVTDTADKKVALSNWQECLEATREVNRLTALLAKATARKAECLAECRGVFDAIIARAGGTLADGQEVTAVTVAQDGSLNVVAS